MTIHRKDCKIKTCTGCGPDGINFKLKKAQKRIFNLEDILTLAKQIMEKSDNEDKHEKFVYILGKINDIL